MKQGVSDWRGSLRASSAAALDWVCDVAGGWSGEQNDGVIAIGDGGSLIRRLRDVGVRVDSVGCVDDLPGSWFDPDLGRQYDAAVLGDKDAGRLDHWGARRLFCLLRAGGSLLAPSEIREPLKAGRLLTGLSRLSRLASGNSGAGSLLGRRLERAGFDLICGGRWNDVLLARKPGGAGHACRTGSFATLEHAIDRYEEQHAADFARLETWRRMHEAVVRNAVPPDRVRAALDACRSIVVISPHPDDELIGCGGLLLDAIRRNVRVTIVQLTDGADSRGLDHVEPPARSRIRPAEARRVAEAMEASALVNFRLRSEQLGDVAAHSERLGGVLKNAAPDVILTPFVDDNQVDHRRANGLLASAMSRRPGTRASMVLSYSVWSPLPAVYVRSIDSVAPRKLDLLTLYPSAMRAVDYVWHCQIRDGYVSRRHLGRSGFAEAFFPLMGRDYVDMARMGAGIARSGVDAIAGG